MVRRTETNTCFGKSSGGLLTFDELMEMNRNVMERNEELMQYVWRNHLELLGNSERIANGGEWMRPMEYE